MTSVGIWQEYISSLSDEKFFYIMRLYLGEIKTPYNKSRLIGQLASFLKNPENTKNAISLLDETDLKILTAIKEILNLTQAKLLSFFSDEFSFPFLYSKISNLTERLWIFKVDSQSDFYRINPLLENEINPFLKKEVILPLPVLAEKSFETPFSISPNFLASFISYIRINGVLLKSDGTFRKPDLAALERIFGGDKLRCLHLLTNAFLNLELLHEGEKNLVFDGKRFDSFSDLPVQKQCIYLSAAAGSRLGRNGLRKQAQLLADCLASIPKEGCTRKTFVRLTHLVSSKNFGSGFDGSNFAGRTMSRFSLMLNRAKNEMNATSADEKENDNAGDINIIDAIFESALEFGLLRICGKTEDGENIYLPGNIMFESAFDAKTAPKIEKVLNINAISSIMLLPGLSLKELLPLTSFMQIVSSSTVTEFEINRHSLSTAFDEGLTLEKIKSLLSEHSTFDLPQNLLVNLEEWHNSYSSAVLYKGYVLKVSKENIARTENNPHIKPYIQEKLSDGIYLLNLPLDVDAARFMKVSGIDFFGAVKTVKKDFDVFSLPEITVGRDFSVSNNSLVESDLQSMEKSEKSAEELKDQLAAKLESLDIDNMQKEILHSRIKNGLILSETQLMASSVRMEIMEAKGIDFHGKIHLVEACIKDGDMLEISLPLHEGNLPLSFGGKMPSVKIQQDGKNAAEKTAGGKTSSPTAENGTFTLFGKPLQLIKHDGEGVLRFQNEPSMEQSSFLISKITHIKRIRK